MQAFGYLRLLYSGSGGWEDRPTLADSPMVFKYKFSMQTIMIRVIRSPDQSEPDTEQIIFKEDNVDYDITQFKHAVNARTIDGRPILLSGKP